MRIALALLAISAVFLLPLIEVETSHEYAEIHCDGYDTPPVATLADMNACGAETNRVEAWRYCACVRPDRLAGLAYYFLFTPLVLAATGLVMLRGRLLAQIAQYAAAATLGTLVSQRLFPHVWKYADEEGRQILLLYSCALAVAGFALIALFRGGAAGIRAWRGRTAKLAAP